MNLKAQLMMLREAGLAGARARSGHARGPDLQGQVFGRLTVAGPAYVPGSSVRRWSCDCDCGGTTIARGHHLTSGRTRSCGCYQRDRIAEAKTTHGLSNTSEWDIWSSMKARCHNENNPAWPRYGGRGIFVFPEWRVSFQAFYAYVGPRPSPAHSIDRIDNDRGYEPGNVRWATAKEQAGNRRPRGRK